MAKKQTKKTERTRSQIIFELAKYAHPRWYHDLLDRDTEMLRALLSYYEHDGDKGIEVEGFPASRAYKRGETVHVLIMPIGVIKKGEPLKNKQRFGGK